MASSSNQESGFYLIEHEKIKESMLKHLRNVRVVKVIGDRSDTEVEVRYGSELSIQRNAAQNFDTLRFLEDNLGGSVFVDMDMLELQFPKAALYRLNSPDTSAILFELLGHQLHFYQDPNSKHLGTTVWDASMVFAKFLEKNCRKGRFSPSKLKGKRAIELGAGCGVAGLGMALLGCDVVSTDQTEVLPLLMRNVERNASRIMQTDPGSDSFGSIEVAELNWGNVDHINAVGPPFDYIIGTDVVYAEHLLEPLLQTMLALSGPKTTILLGYEMRSTNVHEQMLRLWKRNFEVKNVPKAKMDSKYQHSSIQLFIMSLKPSEGSAESMSNGLDQQIDEIGTTDTIQEEDKDADNNNDTEKLDDVGDNKAKEDGVFSPSTHNGKLSEWEARRFGSMAARLLQDVRIT